MPSPRIAPSRSSAQRSGSSRATPGIPRQRLPWLRRRYETRIEPAGAGVGGVTRRRRRPGVAVPSSGPSGSPPGAGTHHLVVIDATRDRQHHAAGPVRAPPVVDDRAMRCATHRPDRCPAISRPSGWPAYSISSKRVKTWSDGESTYMRISSTMTGFSAREVAATEEGPQGQLADRLERHPHVLGWHLGAVDR